MKTIDARSINCDNCESIAGFYKDFQELQSRVFSEMGLPFCYRRNATSCKLLLCILLGIFGSFLLCICGFGGQG